MTYNVKIEVPKGRCIYKYALLLDAVEKIVCKYETTGQLAQEDATILRNIASQLDELTPKGKHARALLDPSNAKDINGIAGEISAFNAIIGYFPADLKKQAKNGLFDWFLPYIDYEKVKHWERVIIDRHGGAYLDVFNSVEEVEELFDDIELAVWNVISALNYFGLSRWVGMGRDFAPYFTATDEQIKAVLIDGETPADRLRWWGSRADAVRFCSDFLKNDFARFNACFVLVDIQGDHGRDLKACDRSRAEASPEYQALCDKYRNKLLY